MSLKPETFYALQCDFPECGVLWEGYEYTYFSDGPDTSDAREDGWYVDDHSTAYCTVHSVEIECPPEQMRTLDGDPFCQWCEDHGEPHLAMLPDTWENRLKVALDRVTDRAIMRLDYLERDVCGEAGKLGPRGAFARQTNVALERIHERTCRAWKPDITGQEIFDLKHGRTK